MVPGLLKRQNIYYDNDGDDGDDREYWGYSDTGVAIKWAFVAAIIFLFLLWFIGGYYHAQRRIKRGLPPLRYHRFLLPHRQRMQYMPRPQYGYCPQDNRYGESYPMQNYVPPPPAYHADNIPPPVYEPTQGGSKVNPAQDWAAPPSGPPPGHMNAAESSNAMESVPLGQGSASQSPVPGHSAVHAKKQGRFSKFIPLKRK